MNRLSTYIFRLFTRETLALLTVMLGLLFLVQCLRIFDVVAVQGQGLLTLFGQALLGMPPLAIVIAYVCMGIALVRGLGALQASQELHIMHTNRQLGSLLGGVIMFAAAGTLIVLLMSNFVAPWASRRLNDWAASIAADIVGRTLTPHRVSQVVPGVTILIGGREGAGNITDFFADDRRNPSMRRTYIAKTAKVATDETGYVLELHDGTLQYLSATHDFSQISFKTYNVGLNSLTSPTDSSSDLGEHNSASLVASALTDGWTPDIVRHLVNRMTEGLRAVAMVVFMAGLTLFPHGRRGRGRVPLELVPLLVAYADRSISGNIGGPVLFQTVSGPLAVLIAGIVILVIRLGFVPHLPARRQPA